MLTFILSIFTQALPFLLLAFGISISYHLLRATDMTLDGSFVLGAAVFARLITIGISPFLALFVAILSGALAGIFVAAIQRHQRIDPLLAGVLATFILSSLNLIVMNKPNISLLTEHTLVSTAFAKNETQGWLLVMVYVLTISSITYLFLRSRFGLLLRALGDNPTLFKRLGKNTEIYRMMGFALTNSLAATAGCLTAQTIGYADIGMGLGMTLTGIGAIILGQQLLKRITRYPYFRIGSEYIACFLGVIFYFFLLNSLLRVDLNPLYLKMILGLLLILFLRAATYPTQRGNR